MKRWFSAVAAVSLAFIGMGTAQAQEASVANDQGVAGCITLYQNPAYGRLFNNCGNDGWVYRAYIEYRQAATGRTYTAVGPYVGHYNYSSTKNVSPNPISRRIYQAVQAE